MIVINGYGYGYGYANIFIFERLSEYSVENGEKRAFLFGLPALHEVWN